MNPMLKRGATMFLTPFRPSRYYAGMKTIRFLAICSSLGLLFSYVWFTQRQGEPTLMPSSKLKQIGLGTALYSVLPGMSPGSGSDVLIKAEVPKASPRLN